MEAGKMINRISNRLRRRSGKTAQKKLGQIAQQIVREVFYAFFTKTYTAITSNLIFKDPCDTICKRLTGAFFLYALQAFLQLLCIYNRTILPL